MGSTWDALKDCDARVSDADDEELQYGASLCTSQLKSHRRDAETELLEEKRLVLTLRSKGGAKVKTKLVFENNNLVGQ